MFGGGYTHVLKLEEPLSVRRELSLFLNYGVGHMGFIHTKVREGGEGHFSRLGVFGAKQQIYPPVVVSGCSSTHIHLAFVSFTSRKMSEVFLLLASYFYYY